MIFIKMAAFFNFTKPCERVISPVRMIRDFMCGLLLLWPLNKKVFVGTYLPDHEMEWSSSWFSHFHKKCRPSLKRQLFLTFPDLVNALSQEPLVRINRDFECLSTYPPSHEMKRFSSRFSDFHRNGSHFGLFQTL